MITKFLVTLIFLIANWTVYAKNKEYYTYNELVIKKSKIYKKFSIKDKSFTGILANFHDNGVLQVKLKIKNGVFVPNKYECYDQFGNIRLKIDKLFINLNKYRTGENKVLQNLMECTYIDYIIGSKKISDEVDGNVTFYFENNTIQTQKIFLNRKLFQIKEFYKNWNLKSLSNYNNEGCIKKQYYKNKILIKKIIPDLKKYSHCNDYFYDVSTNRAPFDRGTVEVYDKNGTINKIVIWRNYKKYKAFNYKNGKKVQIYPNKTKNKQIKTNNKENIIKNIKKSIKQKETEIKITNEEINKISNHIQKYFSINSDIPLGNGIIVALKLSISADGTVKNVEIQDMSRYQKDINFKSVANAAKKAVFDSSPLPLPKGKEKLFTNIILNFNSSYF